MMSLREVDILHEENGLREAFLDETNAHQRQGYYCSSADQPLYDNQDASSTSEDESYELLSAREAPVLKNYPYKRKSHPFRGFSDSMQPGSVKSSVLTMTIAVVGGGILSLPYAVKQSGFIMGVGLVLLFAFITRFSVGMILRAADTVGASSFAELAKLTHGPRLELFTKMVISLNLFGTSVGYVLGAAELLQVALNSLDPDVGFNRQEIIVFLCVVVIFPFSLCRSLGSLRFASLIAVLCIVYMTITIVVKYYQFVSLGYAPSIKYQLHHLVLFETNIERLLEAVPLIIFVYTCHPNIMPICSVLKRPSTRRMHKVVDRSLIIATAVYAICGVFVIFTFGEATKSNFLQNNYHHSTAMIIGAIGFSVALVLTVPLFIHSMKDIVKSVDSRKASLLGRQRIVSSILVVSVAFASICATNIATVLGILGTTTNPIICFLLPAIIARSIQTDAIEVEKRIAGCIAILMSAICIASFIFNVRK